MSKVSIFGVSGSGKTCYLYAASQVLRNGAKFGNDFAFSIISNNTDQQIQLNNGYLEMLANGKWPKGTGKEDVVANLLDYSFNVRIKCKNDLNNKINITLSDYVGGWWKGNKGNRDKLMNLFKNSTAIICLVDGETLLKAMDSNDQDPVHRNKASQLEVLRSRQEIQFIENMFMDYRQQVEANCKPVMVVVTKSDVFASSHELKKGKDLVKDYLVSVFAKGSKMDAAITHVSLGTGLGKGQDEKITGSLSLSTQYNIHLPFAYGLYASLCELYDSPAHEQAQIDQYLSYLREMMKDSVEMFYNGEPTIPIL